MMKTLKEFFKKRKYVAVIYNEESQKLLREWCNDNGFDLTRTYGGDIQDETDFDFHTTIFYTTNEVYLRNEAYPIQPPEKVSITGIKMLGENKDIPVLSVSSKGIDNLRKYYEGLGLEDQWDEYIPHISVSYVRKKVDTSNITLPDFDVYFDKVVVKDAKIF